MSPLPPQLPDLLCSFIDVLALEPPCTDPLARIEELFEGRSISTTVDVLATSLVGLLEDIGSRTPAPPEVISSTDQLTCVVEGALLVSWGIVDPTLCSYAVSLCLSTLAGPTDHTPPPVITDHDPVLVLALLVTSLTAHLAHHTHPDLPADPLRDVLARKAISSDILGRLENFPIGTIDLPPSTWQPAESESGTDNPFDPFDDPLFGPSDT